MRRMPILVTVFAAIALGGTAQAQSPSPAPHWATLDVVDTFNLPSAQPRTWIIATLLDLEQGEGAEAPSYVQGVDIDSAPRFEVEWSGSGDHDGGVPCDSDYRGSTYWPESDALHPETIQPVFPVIFPGDNAKGWVTWHVAAPPPGCDYVYMVLFGLH
jgi:hypothetical protein